MIVSLYQVYLDLFTFITKKLNNYIGKDLRTKVFVALSRRLHFRCRARRVNFLLCLTIRWPEGLCGTVSYKSVNFPQAVAVSKMVEYHETLITSLVTRPGSASTLAIIESDRVSSD